MAIAFLSLFPGCSDGHQSPVAQTNTELLGALVANEELLVELGQFVSRLEDDLSGGGLPGPNTADLLAPDWLASDLEPAAQGRALGARNTKAR